MRPCETCRLQIQSQRTQLPSLSVDWEAALNLKQNDSRASRMEKREGDRRATFWWMMKRLVKGANNSTRSKRLGNHELGAPHIILLAHYRSGLGIKRCLDAIDADRSKIRAAINIIDGVGGIMNPCARRPRLDDGIITARLWWSEAQHEQRALSAIDDCWAKHPVILNGRSPQMAAYYRDHAGSKVRSAAAAAKRYARLKDTAEFKIRRAARNACSRICRIVGSRRKPRTRTFEFLGCDYATAAAHIEAQFRPGMTWANHGEVWEVDHKKPMAAHDLTDETQRMAAMNYKNLQPLFTAENRAKSDTWISFDEENEIKAAA